MAITLKALCKYAKENYGMDLLCGEGSMSNLVNWVHMLEDPETAAFLHGQELVFTTGIGHESTDWLLGFARGLVEHQASGLVLNLGPYIHAIPRELVAYCREVQFPLFSIPWKTRIVDVTNDFCRKIIKSEENEVSVATAFRNAIFFPEKVSEFRPVLEMKEFDLEAGFTVIAVSTQAPTQERFADFNKLAKQLLTRHLYRHSDRFSIFRQDKNLVAVLQEFPQQVMEEALDNLQSLCTAEGYQIRAGVSRRDNGIGTLPANYKRAVALLPIAEKQEKTKLTFEHIGIHQMLIEIGDSDTLRRFHDKVLGPLVDYDARYGTDYTETLKLYLDANASVQDVAKQTYMHRNTINYKIKKIREILRCELTYSDGLNLLLAFHIRELF